jgi:Transposase DDE domain
VNHRLNELKDKARALLLSPQGIEKRSKRPVEVEAVFGQLKSNNKFNRFTLRGLEKVNVEFGLMALGHNFRKWARLLTEKWKNDSVFIRVMSNIRLIKRMESFKFDFVTIRLEKYNFA